MSVETDAALRAAAEAATPGPWRTWKDGHVGCPEGGWIGGIFQPTNGSNPDQRQPDAEYVALANPAAVLDLLDRVEAAEAKVARVEALADDWAGSWELRAQWHASNDLRAALGDPQ